MASSYTTSFGIEKIGSGEQSGAWGDTTNHNIDILDRIASYKAVALSGSTHTLTVREASPGSGTENLQDGMYRVIKFTGALGANNTVTVAPNTTAAFFIMINATTDSGSSGPYSVILTQGSGANITIANGKSAIVYMDGAGSGAAVIDAISDLQLATITASGDVTASGTLNPLGDTTASDKAAIGYTAALGIIVTGQGSTNDITLVNDADGTVLAVPTGTTNVDIVGVATAATFEPDGDTATGDNAAIGYTAAEGLILTGQGSTNDVTIKNDADADVLEIPTGTTNVTIVGNCSAGTLTIGSGSLTDTSGAIDFGNENLVTTGTLGSGAGTVTSLDAGSGTIKTTGTIELGHATDTTLSRASAGKLQVQTHTVATISEAQTFSTAQRGSITALTDASSIATDMALNNFFSVTLAGNRALANPTNIVAGQSGSFFITQDGTGSRTLSYGSYFDFVGGTAPTLTTTAAAVDRVDYIARTTTSLQCVWSGALS